MSIAEDLIDAMLERQDKPPPKTHPSHCPTCDYKMPLGVKLTKCPQCGIYVSEARQKTYGEKFCWKTNQNNCKCGPCPHDIADRECACSYCTPDEGMKAQKDFVDYALLTGRDYLLKR